MNKDHLVEIIQKYHLGGLTEKAKWIIKDNKVTINFATELKDCIGTLTSGFEMEDTDLGIFNTTQFLKLVNIINDPFKIDLITSNRIAMSLGISDSNFDLSYHLADLGLITEGKLSNTLPDPVIELSLDDEFISKFIKAHNALEKVEMFSIKPRIDTQKIETIQFTIGLNDHYSNKIVFDQPTKKYAKLNKFNYRVNNFREILSTNKDNKIDMAVYEMGIIKLTSISENVSIDYYLVSQNK